MGDRTKIQQKKAVTSTYSQPTLAQKSIQGFGLSSFSSSQSIALPQNHDISRISLRPQAKLTVSQPGDIYEQEADNVAEQVMRMAVPETLEFSSAQTAQNSLQRKCAACENEEAEEIQRKPTLQRAAESNIQQSNNIESQLSATQGGGSPLSDDVRGFMEPRFGADFSSVRVHTGSAAVQLSRDLGAQAFTYGSDVYFGAGKAAGKDELTAHELTHVVQQKGTTQAKFNYTENTDNQLLQRELTDEENHTDLGETTIYSDEIDVGETTIYSDESDQDNPTSQSASQSQTGAGGASGVEQQQAHEGGAEGASGSEHSWEPSNMQFVHDTLGWMGTLPAPYSVVPNLLNAASYTMEGDYKNAAISGVSAATGGLPQKFKYITKWGGLAKKGIEKLLEDQK